LPAPGGRSKKVAVVNLHLHHGPDTIEKNLARKKAEIQKLCQWLEPRLDGWDLLVVCGDFNGDPDSASVAPLLSLGLQDASHLAQVTQEPTWDPERNSIANKSHTLVEAPEVSAWDAGKHVFDRVYLKSKQPLDSVGLTLIREPELSDHFAVSVEIG
jgi:endonuclease/exonuclease/phosphatase family metal-dependent hydrolase